MITDDIRNGVLDCNNQELFIKNVIKGLLINLNQDIKIRKIGVPHITYSLGDDLFFLENKGYDKSKEPNENTNENYIYQVVPRCMVNPQNIDVPLDQLTSPYSRGEFEYQTDDDIYTFSAEMRRIPIKINFDLNYITDTYTDMLILIQQIITKLMFVRTYNITYLGQVIKCSYKVPEAFQDEHTIEFSGDMSEKTNKKINLSIEVETNIPVYNLKTVMNINSVIKNCNRAKPGDAYNIKLNIES